MKKIMLSLFLAACFFAANSQTDSLTQYTGKYVFPDGSVVPSVDVALSEGALSMSSAAGSSPLTQLGLDSFEIVQFTGTAVFRRGEDKTINAVHIEAMGYVLDGQKQSNGIWIFREYYLPVNRELLFSRK
ncbi:MAG: hypothetical protein HZB42_01430 [Sphingobacteriales bacterium]|nr:hypothetical protein [Sphingobacteriales bacterium]